MGVAGDVNAFFGLMLDNIANLVLVVSLLAGTYGFPAKFALAYMVPGTALGVLFGDLIYSLMAIRLAQKTGNHQVTAMPLGLDTPSAFGMVFFVLGPAFEAAKNVKSIEEAALHTWHIGICTIVTSGLFKLACSFGAGWVRRMIPRAGLLGSLAAIALVLISFLPLLDILHLPVVGLTSLAIILTTLIGRIQAPGRIPGTLIALVIGSALFYLLRWLGHADPPSSGLSQYVWLPTDWVTAWRFEWLTAWKESLNYLPVVIPFALATVVGGIDCTESASAVGDEYSTGAVVAVEGFATLLAGLCGGVIQTTPYIGQPAYKAMGARAGYTLATAIFIGSAGLIGYFGIMYEWLPRPAIFPVLIFVGLEITAQSFDATPRKHFPAVALACVPAMAYLVMIFAGHFLAIIDKPIAELGPPLNSQLPTLLMLSNGFIVTSLLWASTLAALVDRKLNVAAIFMAIAGICSFFGVIHSPLDGGPLALPWHLPAPTAEAAYQTPYWLTTAYLSVSVLLVAWQWWENRTAQSKPKKSTNAERHPK